MARDDQGQVVLRGKPAGPSLGERPTVAAVLAAVRSGRAFAVTLAAFALAFMVALVVIGGDTVALTETVEVAQATIDVMALVSGSAWVLLLTVLLGLLAFVPAVWAGVDWWSGEPRLAATGVPLGRVADGPDPGGRPAVVRRGLTGLGKALFFMSLAVLFIALAVSSRTRGAQTVLVGEGAAASVSEPQESPYRWDVGRTTPADAGAVPTDETILVDAIDLALDENLDHVDGPGALSTATRADVSITGPAGTAFGSVAPWPGTRIAGRDVYLSLVGLAPRIVVTDPKGSRPVDARIVATLLPRGTPADISLTPAPLRVELTAVAALTPVRKTPAPVVYDATLKDAKGNILARERLRPGQTITARGYRVSIPETGAWARVTFVRDPSVQWVFAAVGVLLASMLVGPAARLWPRLELAPDPDREGRVRLVRPRWTVAAFAPRSLRVGAADKRRAGDGEAG